MSMERKLEDVEEKLEGISAKLDEIETTQHSIRRRLPSYFSDFLIFIAAVTGIKSCEKTQTILSNYQQAPQVQVQNVIGEEVSERFYELNGQRVYLKIDGKPVEEYVLEK